MWEEPTQIQGDANCRTISSSLKLKMVCFLKAIRKITQTENCVLKLLTRKYITHTLLESKVAQILSGFFKINIMNSTMTANYYCGAQTDAKINQERTALELNKSCDFFMVWTSRGTRDKERTKEKVGFAFALTLKLFWKLDY